MDIGLNGLKLKWLGSPVWDALFLELLVVAEVEGGFFYAEFWEAFVDHEGEGGFPPSIEGFAEFVDDFGVGCCDVFFLGGIFGNIVELPVFDQAPLGGADGGFSMLEAVALSGLPAAAVDEEFSIGPGCFGVFEEGEE